MGCGALIATWQENEKHRERQSGETSSLMLAEYQKMELKRDLARSVSRPAAGTSESRRFPDLPCLLPIRQKYNLRMAASLPCRITHAAPVTVEAPEEKFLFRTH